MNDDTRVPETEAPAVADTADTQEVNTTDVQTKSETPEATQPQEEQVEVKAQDTVEEKLYAGKYKSVEEMEKAYTELQSNYTKNSQEKAELSKILAEAFSSEPAPQPAQPSYDYDEDEPAKPNANDGVNRDIAVMKFVMSNPDADGKAMVDVLSTDPFISKINGYEAQLRYAHAVSQNTARPKVVEEAKKQAQVDTQVKIAEKQAAQVESASKQAAPTKEEPMTQSQLREALRSDDGFSKILKNRPGFKDYLG